MKKIVYLFYLFPCFIFSQAIIPFDCDSRIYFFRYSDSSITGAIKLLSSIENYSTSPITTDICPIKHNENTNGLAANPVDGFLYYIKKISLTQGMLYRLDANCDTTALFTLPWSETGAFDHLGRYWFINLSNDNLLAKDINTGNTVKGPFPLSGQINNMRDIAFNFNDCKFYGGNSTETYLIDTSGTVTKINGGFGGSSLYGGIAIGNDGNIYSMDNASSAGGSSSLVKYNLTNNSADITGIISPGSHGNSGADMANFPCDKIDALAIASPLTGCAPLQVNFSHATTGLFDTILWDFGDGTTSTNAAAIHTYSLTGSYQVKLIASLSVPACYIINPDTFDLIIDVLPEIATVNVPASFTICEGGSVSITAQGSGNYTWLPNTGINTTAGSNVILTPAVTSTYSVITTGCYGSIDKKTIFVQVENCSQLVYFPNVFTPNHDMLNDTFGPSYNDTIANYQLKIFNRWGELLFETKNIDEGWNGEYKGQNSPTGVYLYISNYFIYNGLIQTNGHLVLIR